MSIHVINLRDEAEKLRGRFWQAKELAFVNNHALKIGCTKGEYVWHKHDDSDELFIVYKGKLTIEFKDHKPVTLTNSDIVVVPKGVWHRPTSSGESIILMVEPIHMRMTTK